MKKKLMVALPVAGFLAVLMLMPGAGGDLLTALAAPFAAAGGLLRRLSLSGGIGNAVSLGLYGLLCLWPLLIWRRSRRGAEDWLLVLLCLVLVYVMYLMVNPALRPAIMQNTVGDVTYAGAVWSVLVSWGVMKLLRSSDAILEGNIYRALRIFLLICGAECIIEGVGLGFAELREQIVSVQEGNTMFGVNLWPTYLLLGLRFAVGALESTMLAVIFGRGEVLLEQMERDPYSAECLDAGARVVLWCKRTLLFAAAADLALNLMQVFLAGMLHSISVTMRLPVTAIAVSFGMMALTRLLGQGKAIKDDNDLFI